MCLHLLDRPTYNCCSCQVAIETTLVWNEHAQQKNLHMLVQNDWLDLFFPLYIIIWRTSSSVRPQPCDWMGRPSNVVLRFGPTTWYFSIAASSWLILMSLNFPTIGVTPVEATLHNSMTIKPIKHGNTPDSRASCATCFEFIHFVERTELSAGFPE